jgi:hypothetical protein
MNPSFKTAFNALVTLDSPWILYGIGIRMLRLLGVACIIVLVALGVRSLFMPIEANGEKPAVEQPLNGAEQNNPEVQNQ